MSEQKVTAEQIKYALAKKHVKDFFLTEVKNGSTYFPPLGGLKILDGLAIAKSWTRPCFTGYEVKVSRGDFLRDAKFYTYENLVHRLYIACPKGLIDRTELPESVGLVYYDPEKQALQTKKQAIHRDIEITTDMLLYIIFSKLDSDRIPFFADKREYWEAYLDGKVKNRSLACRVKSKLAADNARLEEELDHLLAFKKDWDVFREIRAVLEKHSIFLYGTPERIAEQLDRNLTKKLPPAAVEVRKALERQVAVLRYMEEQQGEEAGKEGAEHEETEII